MTRLDRWATDLHPFYDLPRPLLWALALALGALALAPLAAFWALVFTADDGFSAVGWVAAAAVGAPLLQPWLQLTAAPLLRLTGRTRYFSPMLLAEAPTPEQLQIHGGTLFDYLLHFRPSDRGQAATRSTMRFYVDGLVAIADEVRRGTLAADVRIVGVSWFFSEETARRLGFTVESTRYAERLGLWASVVAIALKHSFARGYPAWPDLRRIRKVTITGSELVAHVPELERLRSRLRAR